MNRIATTLTTITASVLLSQTLGAAEPTLQSLESRLISLETRLLAIEGKTNEDRSNYSYSNAATVEATKGGQTQSIPAPVIPAETAPAPAPAPAPAATGPGETYVIQDGDTLGKIAAKFGVERKAVLEANRLSEGQPIYIGETLMIPGAVASANPTAAPQGPAAPATNPSVPAPAKKDAIVVGETKKPAPASTTLHTVAKGDTLTSISKKYGTSVDSLKSANGLRSDTISLGQSLKIPSSKPSGSQAEAKTQAPVPQGKPGQSSDFEYDNPLLDKSETYGYYTVAKGDNLYALARDFFTTMSELQRVNNLGSSTVIRPGDDIIVPTSKYNAYHKTGEMANR